MLGLLVAARPYIRTGLHDIARQQVPAPQFPGYFNRDGMIERIKADHERRIRAAMPDVIAERVVAVVAIIAGTLLNGYGSPLARVFGWPI